MFGTVKNIKRSRRRDGKDRDRKRSEKKSLITK